MGACDFDVFGVGFNVKDVFNELVNNALFEYGHDSYNGTISTTSLLSNNPVLTFETKKYNNLTKKELTIINETVEIFLEKLDKRECAYINCGIMSENLITVKTKNISKRKSEYYMICNFNPYNNSYAHYSEPDNKKTIYQRNQFNNLDTATKYAKQIALKYGIDSLAVCNEKYKPIVDVILTKKEVKRKITRQLKDNEKILTSYNFLFFGWASC